MYKRGWDCKKKKKKSEIILIVTENKWIPMVSVFYINRPIRKQQTTKLPHIEKHD